MHGVEGGEGKNTFAIITWSGDKELKDVKPQAQRQPLLVNSIEDS